MSPAPDPALIVARRMRRTSRPGRWWARGGIGFSAILGVALAVVAIAGAWGYAGVTQNLPSLEILPVLLGPQGQLRKPTRLLDRTGQHTLHAFTNPNAIGSAYIPLSELAFSGAAIVAELDPAYWEHDGVALRSWDDPAPHTLAERLVSELLLYNEPPSLARAIRMRLLAAQTIQTFGHEQVLEWFVNSADFGQLTRGIDEAAHVYFGKQAIDLTLAEQAMLAAIAGAPALNPLDAPSLALERQGRVLQKMFAQGLLSSEQALSANSSPLTLAPPAPMPQPIAPDLVALALDQLAPHLPLSRLQRGGIDILTTLDAELQHEANCAAEVQAQRLKGERPIDSLAGIECPAARLLPTLTSIPQSSGAQYAAQVVILDNATSQILALVGPPETPHTPGTSLSPFVYLTAFTRGFGPASLVWDIPASLPPGLEGHANADGQFHGPLRIRIALANDYVVPALQILNQIGPANAWRTAGQSGLASLSGADDARLLLDSGEVALLPLTHAYSLFGNQGLLAGQGSADSSLFPSAVLYVTDSDGRVLLDWSQPEQRAVTSAQLAYLITDVLSDVLARQPSLGRPNPLEVGRPAAAKLGQTISGTEVWTFGYSPQRTVGVWIGDSQSGSASPLSPLAAAGLWHAVFRAAHSDLPAAAFEQPVGLTRLQVCDPSGLLPTAVCPSIVEELFIPGNEPLFADNLYLSVQVNRQTGRLATVFTPPELVESRIVFAAPPEAQEWALSAGLPLAPEDYDVVFTSANQGLVAIDSPELFDYVSGRVVISGRVDVPDFSYYRIQIGEGLNPRQWLQLGSDFSMPVVEGLLAEWDTTGLNGLYAIQLLAVDNSNVVHTATIQVTVDNAPPTLRVLYPTEGLAIANPGAAGLTFQAQSDDAIALAQVELWVDGQLLISLAKPPFVAVWQPTAPGRHTLLVRAYDAAGNRTEQSIEFSIDG